MSFSVIEKALQCAWPTADETLLLRALVLRDERGAAAWREFSEVHADLAELFRTDHGEWRRLSPLLARSLKASGAEVSPALWTVLRMAAMRESLRAEIYQKVLAEVVGALEAEGVEFALFRGAAIGALAYDEVAARHSHDIDVLLNASVIEVAHGALAAAGFTPEPQRPEVAGEHPASSLLHATSLPVRLHGSLFELTGYSADTAALLAGARRVDLAGVIAPVIAVEALMVQVLVHASYSPTRYTLQWVPDAVGLAPLVGGWARFVELVEASRAALPVYSMLSWLKAGIGGDAVPEPVLARIRDSAQQASAFDRDLALYGARRGSRQGVAGLFNRVPILSWVRLVKWLAIPSRGYLGWTSKGMPLSAGYTQVSGFQLALRVSRYLGLSR